SLGDLLAGRRVAVPGAIAQIVVASALGLGVARLWGWNVAGGLVFGLALSVASTVVLLRALETRGGPRSEEGRIAVGWLIVEDLLMVVVLVLLPILATRPSNPDEMPPGVIEALGLTLGKLFLFVAIMTVAGARLLPWTLLHVVKTGSRELFTLAVIAVSL